MTPDQINDLIAKLEKVKNILNENLPDIDISEWNTSPIGRATNRLQDVIDLTQAVEEGAARWAEREAKARAYCAEHGLDPDDLAADAVLVWQVVAKEIIDRDRLPIFVLSSNDGETK